MAVDETDDPEGRPGDGQPTDADPVVLVEPVRTRLVTIAADVLGRMSAEETPVVLRPIARFTPGRRERLGATALAAALDAEAAFRDRVGEAVADSSPQLAQAVRDGAPTAASDPVDVAVVAYLLRPPGWSRTIAAAAERWRTERNGRTASDGAELAGLREQLAALRAERRGEPRRVRDAVDREVSAAATELSEARHQARTNSVQLRAAERERDEAVAALTDERRRRSDAEQAWSDEQRRLQNRIVELERAADVTRRSARHNRAMDEARLWLLVETVADAASGIRRELGLRAPSVRPSETVSSWSPDDPRRRFAGDVAALDRLLVLPNVHLVVDGYNVTKTGYGELALADQRARLLASLAALAGRTRAEVTVAFDGAQRPPVLPAAPRNVRVLFSAPDQIADDLIRQLVAAEPEGRAVVVVSSDQAIQRDVQRTGAWAVPSSVLLDRLAA